MMGLLETLGWTRVIKNVLRHVETEEPWGLGTDWQVAFPWFQNLKWQIQCLGEDEEVSRTHESFHPPNQNRADSPNSFGIGTSAPAWTCHYIPGVGRQWFWTHQMVLRAGWGEGNQYPAIKVTKAVKNLDLLLLTLMCQLGIFLQLRSSYNLVKLSEGWPSTGLSPATTLAADGTPGMAAPARVHFMSQ